MKINREVAEQEVKGWVKAKGFRASKVEKEDFQESIDLLIDSVMDGLLSVNEDNSLTYKLQYPIQDEDGNNVLESMTFNKRLTVGFFTNKMKSSKAKTQEEKTILMISELTGEPAGLIQKVQMADFTELGVIATFFLI